MPDREVRERRVRDLIHPGDVLTFTSDHIEVEGKVEALEVKARGGMKVAGEMKVRGVKETPLGPWHRPSPSRLSALPQHLDSQLGVNLGGGVAVGQAHAFVGGVGLSLLAWPHSHGGNAGDTHSVDAVSGEIPLADIWALADHSPHRTRRCLHQGVIFGHHPGRVMLHATANIPCVASVFKFSQADLSGADLKQADFSGADLSSTNLREANLSQARYDKATKWPDNFDPTQAGAICED